MTEVLHDHIKSFSDEELEEILRRDYLRRLVRYKKTDALMQQKYGMTYDEFISHDVIANHHHSWEVESDSQDWEMALDGISSMKRKLREIGT